MPFRYDASTLGSIARTPQGGLKIPARPTRVGVFSYVRPDGTVRREYRPAEEVFAEASLASLQNAPVTYLHPEKAGIRLRVTPDNYRSFSVGHVGTDVRADGDHVAATVLVQDSEGITRVENGTARETSCGYDCQFEDAPGTTPKGEKYDVIQRNIRYNHLALGPVGWARGGPTTSLRLDSAEDAVEIREDSALEYEIINGVKLLVGSTEWAAALRQQMQAAIGRADSNDAALKKAQADLSIATDPKTLALQINARVQLVTDCKRIATHAGAMFKDADIASADASKLMTDSIKLVEPSFTADGKPSGYLEGYFGGIVSRLDSVKTLPVPATSPANVISIYQAREGTAPAIVVDEKDKPDPDKARLTMIEKNRKLSGS